MGAMECSEDDKSAPHLPQSTRIEGAGSILPVC